MKIEENFECNDDNFYLETKNTLLELMNKTNIKYNESENEYFKKISNILFYIKENIKEIKLYVESNCEDFFKNLKIQIKEAKNYIEDNFRDNKMKCFKYFDMIFEKEINNEKTSNQKNFRNEKEKIINKLVELQQKYKIEKIFDNYSEKIFEVFNEIKEKKESLISKYNKDIKKLIKVEIEEKIKGILENELNKDIEIIMKELDNEIFKYKNKLLDLFKMSLEKEIKKGKYKTEIEVIFNFSFYEKLKIKFSQFVDSSKIKKGIIALTIGAIISVIFVLNFAAGLIFFFVSIASWIANFFKSYSKIFDEKVEEISLKYNIEFERMRIKFTRLYRDTLNDTKNLFEDLLSVASLDLSKIEEKEWNNLKIEYFKIKDNILMLS